ncbi:MAG TPA: hypothetical protein VGC74_05260 [Stenotrophomonas sp.]
MDAIDVYRRFCRWAVLAILAGLGTLLPLPAQASVLCALASLSLVVIAALSTLRFVRHWRNHPRCWQSPVFWLGLAFMAAGVAFDILATLRHSPDLALEGNPIAVALLEQGLPIAGVKLFGLVAQVMLMLGAAMLWGNFCVRREWYLRRLDALGDGSLSLHLLGLGRASLVGVMLGVGSDIPLLVSTLGALMPGAFAYRWYLGLEWFGWVPISRIWAPLGCVGAAWLALYAWTSYRLTPGAPPAADA